MMKEFHAEDSQRRGVTEISLAALINATAEHPKASPAVADQVKKSAADVHETQSPVNRTDMSPSLVQQPLAADLNQSHGLKVK